MFKNVYSLKPYSAFCIQPAFYSQSAVCILHSVCILPLVRSLKSAVRSVRFTQTVYFLLCVSPGTKLILGNLRTTTKFTTTTSVDRERTGTRTSVSAGKRKPKMQSIGRSTTTTLNVNKHVEVVQL